MILRKRFKDGYQINIWMGKEYHLVQKELSPDGIGERFKETAAIVFGDGWEKSPLFAECYAFVIHNYDRRQKAEPLYIGQDTWVLSPDGTVFENLTFR